MCTGPQPQGVAGDRYLAGGEERLMGMGFLYKVVYMSPWAHTKQRISEFPLRLPEVSFVVLGDGRKGTILPTIPSEHLDRMSAPFYPSFGN